MDCLRDCPSDLVGVLLFNKISIARLVVHRPKIANVRTLWQLSPCLSRFAIATLVLLTQRVRILCRQPAVTSSENWT